MDVPVLSLKDRINALNSNQNGGNSNPKPVHRASVKIPTNTQTETVKSFLWATRNGESGADKKEVSPPKNESVYGTPSSRPVAQNTSHPSKPPSKQDDEDMYVVPSSNPSFKKPVAKGIEGYPGPESKNSNSSTSARMESLYSATPSNKPLQITVEVSHCEQNETVNSKNAGNGANKVDNAKDISLYSDVPKNTPAYDVSFPTIQKPDDGGMYAVPRDIPVTPDKDENRTLLPDGMSSRWQKLRQTVTDRKMRTMVDMTELASPPPNDVLFPRSMSFEGSMTTTAKGDSQWKRPSLPTMNELYNFTETTSGTLSPKHPSGLSRNSSVKSNKSSESGNVSDMSEATSTTSYDFGRPRNISDVSVTMDENSYLTFSPINHDEETNNPAVEDDRRLSAIEDGTSKDISRNMKKSGSISSDEQETDSPERRKKKKNKLKNALKHKLAKVKGKKSSTTSSLHIGSPVLNSPRSVPQSPFMTSPQRIPASPVFSHRNYTHSSAMMLPHKRHGSERHMTHTPGMMTSPGHNRSRGTDLPPAAPKRPMSMFPVFSPGSSVSSDTLDGIYFDPSQPDDEDETLTIEVIQEEDDDEPVEDNKRYCDVIPLTSVKRCYSLENLVEQDNNKLLVQSRKMAESTGDLRMIANEPLPEGLYVDPSIPPVPPPKVKSIKKKNEKKLAESEYMTSLPSMDNTQEVKMRNKSPTNAPRENWPGGRPPSMPFQMPPAPPRPPSMPLNEPPIQPLDQSSDKEEENTYIAPSSGTVKESPFHKENVAQKLSIPTYPPPKTPPVFDSKLSTPSAPWLAKRCTEQENTPDVSLEQDSIYYTVDDQAKETPKVTNTVIRHVEPPRAKESLKPTPSPSVNRTYETKVDEEPPALQPRKPSLQPKLPPSKPLSLTKPLVGKKPSVQTFGSKPAIENRRKMEVPPPAPKLPPKPAELKTLLNLDEVQGNEIPVVPPPRPSKYKKFQNKVTIPETTSEEPPDTPPRSATISELGRKISMGSMINNKPFPIPPGPKRNNFISNGDMVDPKTTTHPKQKTTPQNIKPRSQVLLSKSQSVDVSSFSSARKESQDDTAASRKLSIVVMKNTLQSTVSQITLNRPTSPDPTVARITPRRPPPKKPTTAPPPRPTAPPPAPPDKLKTVTSSMQASQPAPKKPPSRPPPPSSAKIKAAEQRRKLMSVQEPTEEDDYNDTSIKTSKINHSSLPVKNVHQEEDNTYADIDEIFFPSPNSDQFKRPSSPPRTKPPVKRAVSGIGAISNFLQRRTSNEKVQSKQEMNHNAIMCNEIEEERIYAGIDDI